MTKEELDKFGVAVGGDSYSKLDDRGKVMFLAFAMVCVFQKFITDYVKSSRLADKKADL